MHALPPGTDPRSADGTSRRLLEHAAWGAVLATLVVATVLATLWAMPSFRGDHSEGRPHLDAHAAATQLSASLASDGNFLRYLATDVSGGGLEERDFRHEVAVFLSAHPSLVAVRWEDPERGQRWSEPPSPLGALAEAADQARRAASGTEAGAARAEFSGAFGVSGGPPTHFEVYVREGTGVISATYSLAAIAGHAFPEWLSRRYRVEVAPAGSPVPAGAVAASVPDTRLGLRLQPRPGLLRARSTIIGTVGLWLVTAMGTVLLLQVRMLDAGASMVARLHRELAISRRIGELVGMLSDAGEDAADTVVAETAAAVTESPTAFALPLPRPAGLPEADDLAAWAARHHKPAIIEAGDPMGAGRTASSRALCVPAVRHGERVGVVVVAGSARPYTDVDVARLQQVASPYACLLLRRRAIEELAASERRYGRLVELAADAVFVFDQAGRVVQANRRARESLGYDPDEILALRLDDIETRVDPALVRQHWRALEPGHGFTTASAHRRKDGGEVPVEVRYSPIGGADPHFLAVARDVSERRRTEELLLQVARGVSSLTGAWFFRSMAEHLLGRVRSADCVAVGELLEGSRWARTVAVVDHTGDGPNLDYSVEGTLAAAVAAAEGHLAIPDLAGRFARDPLIEGRGYRAAIATAIRDSRGEAMGFIAILSRTRIHEPVITGSLLEIYAVRAAGELDRQQVEAGLEAEQSFLQQVIDGVPVPITVIGTDHRVRLLNRAARQVATRNGTQAVPTTCYRLGHDRETPCEGEHHVCPMVEAMRTRSAVCVEHVHTGPDGEPLTVEVEAAPITDHEGRVIGIIETLRDVTRQRAAETRLREHSRHLDFLAHHDPLTGLPNRTLFKDRLNQAIIKAHRDGRAAALLFLDLDGFKDVNDSLGHEVGDELLKVVAERLRRCVRASDTVARFGGDEFTLVMDDIQTPNAVRDVAAKIVEMVGRPIRVGPHEMTVGASIGVALYPQDGQTVEALVRNADAAMYLAKDRGRGNFQYFTPELNALARKRLEMEHGLRLAVERGELRLFYQPQFALCDGKLVAIEALVRWESPDLGLLPAGRFLDVAEETGLIHPVGEWVARAACAQVAAWDRASLRAPPVALNLSPRQLHSIDLPLMLEEVASSAGVDPRRIELEVSERVVLDDSGVVEAAMSRVAGAGFRLVLDNFGSWRTSLQSFEHGGLHKLKLDRTYVSGAGAGAREQLARALVDMAHSFGVEVVGTGVENDEHLAFLRRTGCDGAQGYRLGHPVSGREMTELLDRGSKAGGLS